ncbi:MAG: protein translocase subunit SecD [Candidatus Chisholmbacteria bacterium]|nr:protein translocase subunit SecD [Candidatus Chisholmbacteria bacterium]
MSQRSKLVWLGILVIVSILVVVRPEFELKLGPVKFYKDLKLKQGLDIAGGVHLGIEALMTEVAAGEREEALESAAEVIRRRVDLFGVTEAVVQTVKAKDQYRIIAELPGLQRVDEAISLLGQTATLSFREQVAEAPPEDGQASPAALLISDFRPTDLSGKDLRKAAVQFDQTTGKPVVALEFKEEGRKKFAELTRKNLGRPVAIFLDELPVTIPVVQQEIVDGNAVITGGFSTDEAERLAVQLNAGALPVPIEVVEQRNVGATLGQESVRRSLQAGLVGLTLVALFMMAYYGRMGMIAVVALGIYALITVAIYKLIPVTVSLPGLAGLILSIGMAVDSNILIFERFKEERRQGLPWRAAMERGFGRAWDSIKDANVATLTTAFILLNPLDWRWLPTSGMVRGFALTLSLGILVSLFTGVMVSRTLMRSFYREKDI